MRFPPARVLRAEAPPHDQLLVVRGGSLTLSDSHLTNQVSDCWERHRFFGVSVFGVPDDDLTVLSQAVRAIRVRSVVRVARCGELRSAGFEVLPTFPNPHHFSLVLPDAAPATFESLRRCFSDDPMPNPGYQPEE